MLVASLFLTSVWVSIWEHINEICAVETVDEFAFFERTANSKDWLGIFHEGFVEGVFWDDEAFVFSKLCWSTVRSATEAVESFALNSEECKDDFKVHFWKFLFFKMLLLTTESRGRHIYKKEWCAGPPLDGDLIWS